MDWDIMLHNLWNNDRIGKSWNEIIMSIMESWNLDILADSGY